MKQSLILIAIALTTIGLFLSGCRKQEGPIQTDPNGVVNESSALIYLTQNQPFVQNDIQTFVDQGISPSSTTSMMMVDSAITPVRWGRYVRSVSDTFMVSVLPGDTISMVTIHRTVSGTFVIVVRNTPPEDSTQFSLVQKPFTDTTERTVVLKRINTTGLFVNRWIPVASSLVNGGTLPPNNAIAITKAVFIFPTGDSLVVTNPDTTFLLFRWTRQFVHHTRDVPECVAGDRIHVRVTVVSKDSTGDYVALRYGVNSFHFSRYLLDLVSSTDNGDGTFMRVYQTSADPHRYLYIRAYTGWFHFGIDAVTDGTVLDDQRPYSASWWAIPYRVF